LRLRPEDSEMISERACPRGVFYAVEHDRKFKPRPCGARGISAALERDRLMGPLRNVKKTRV
jgi:hypothetical protein